MPDYTTASLDFCHCLQDLVLETRPQRVLETGTFVGAGTTFAIAQGFAHNSDNGYAHLWAIEAHPDNAQTTRAFLRCRKLDGDVTVMEGFSVPKRMIPGKRKIKQILKERPKWARIDNREELAADGYYRELHFQEELKERVDYDGEPLKYCLISECRKLAEQPFELIVLDSCGVTGWAEFQYLMETGILWEARNLAIDDLFHVKHWKTFEYIKERIGDDFDFKELCPPKYVPSKSHQVHSGFCIVDINWKKNIGRKGS